MVATTMYAQENEEKQKELRQAQEYLSDASLALQKEEFVTAEAEYRKAIALNPSDETGKYNLGTAYYGKSKNEEALNRFKQAASVATSKAEKHKAFHNLGNTYMNEKKYTEAVEAYKNALRNNPTDDESRYNLALAKEMLEKNPPQDDKGDDENKDQDKDQDNKDQQDQKDQGDKDDNKDGNPDDQKDNQDKGDQKDDKKEGDDQDDKGKPDEPKDPKEGEGDKPQQQQPVPGQLSPQQVESLLEAMNNQEKKVQDKMNAQKQKGAKVKSNKDW
ncbi:hypothetical protein GCM10008083_02370 [Ulvibacter litoralis]|nr:hypothetical protein GCM10008083_02370 [Ulvibacter litoralis]